MPAAEQIRRQSTQHMTIKSSHVLAHKRDFAVDRHALLLKIVRSDAEHEKVSAVPNYTIALEFIKFNGAVTCDLAH